MTIWVDIEDLLAHFYAASRPSGIQRLSYEVYRALARQAEQGEAVKFVRHRPNGSDLEEVFWPDIEARVELAFSQQNEATMIDGPVDQDMPAPTRAMAPPSRLRAWGRNLPMDLRAPLAGLVNAERAALAAQRDAMRAAGDLLRGLRRWAGLGGSGALGTVASVPMPASSTDHAGSAVKPEPGDVFLALGASWQGGYYPALVESLKRRFGVRFAFMVYDLIPILWPEFVMARIREPYRAWLTPMLRAADIVFTISEATTNDVLAFAAQAGIRVPATQIVPIGVTFPERTSQPAPVSRPYVLMVSTIEIRKNHALIFKVWRRLMAQLPAEQVPTLVFAGRIGWQTADLLAQIENTNHLDGLLRVIEAPSDQELAALYQNCLFTVFPSFYEGWGLPVTESLSFGKTVAAAHCASIPEAGGAFCDYFDPDNLHDAYRVIARLITDPDHRRDLEQRIEREFRPPSWADSAAAIFSTLRPTPIEAARPLLVAE
jgi:glycosyltransferase involved in cell wall biosynthesis